MTLTYERLRELLTYDRQTGQFRWLVSRGRVRQGDTAGTRRKDGYILIRVDGVHYLAHRLAWLYETGGWPEADIDHRDRCPSHNAFLNLRPTTRQQNHHNLNLRPGNTTGFPGVSLVHGRADRWRAVISINGRQKSLGRYSSPEEAGAAYAAAKETRDKEIGL